jgi:hypothetical protein
LINPTLWVLNQSEKQSESYVLSSGFFIHVLTAIAYAARTYFLSPRKKVSKESSRLNLLNDQLRNMNVPQLTDSYAIGAFRS